MSVTVRNNFLPNLRDLATVNDCGKFAWPRYFWSCLFRSCLRLGSRGLSYIVGVLLVLGVTLAAVVVFTQAAGFQFGVLNQFAALDVRRAGESLVVAEAHGSGVIIFYNNGVLPVCVAEVHVVQLGSGVVINPCLEINPRDYASYPLLASGWPTGEYTLLVRTSSGKIFSFHVFVP